MNIDTFFSTYATPFGSRVWATPGPDSDFDYLLPYHRKPDLISLLENLGVSYTEQRSSYLLAGIDFSISFGQFQISVAANRNYLHHLNTISLLNRLHSIAPETLDTKAKRCAIYSSAFALCVGLQNTPSPVFSPDHFPELYL